MGVRRCAISGKHVPHSARPAKPAGTPRGFLLAACLLLIGIGIAPVPAVAETCPDGAAPPPAVDASEEPKPGMSSPEPLPVPERPVGGPALGECGAVTPSDATSPQAITARTWVLADLDSGAVLAAKDAHARQRPASIIKLLTALVAVRELDMDAEIVATAEDTEQEGSGVGLQPGVTYTVRDVLTGMILRSGNDAAHALAVKLGGVDAALDKMNALAERLGAQDTRVATPSGLDGPGMSTSAYDMALILRAALREPEFAAIGSVKEAELPSAPEQQPLHVASDNDAVNTYPGTLAAKNGFTDDAQHTFAAAAERDGHRLVATLMNGDRSLGSQATKLLDYGFGLDDPAAAGTLVPERVEPAAPPNPPPAPPPPTQAASHGSTGWQLLSLVTLIAAVFLGFAVRRRRTKRTPTGEGEPVESSDRS